MKKQSSGHREDRQDVSTVTPFPGQSLTGSKPRGVHTGERSKPTQLNAGAADSKTHPVEMHGNRGSRSHSSGNRSSSGSSRSTSSTSRTRMH